MNNRPVLSAAYLRITPEEHAALLETRELIAKKAYHDAEVEGLAPDGFNMNTIITDSDCGTTACIGGWMFLIMERNGVAPSKRAVEYVNNLRSRELQPLFYPFTNVNQGRLLDRHGNEYDFPPYELIPPAWAVAAIDNFLTTGDPNWPAVCMVDSEVAYA
jgi:hypothetical protein